MEDLIECKETKSDQVETVFERVQSEAHDRLNEIVATMHVARAARDNAASLDLKFETYLLDMAVIAFSERLSVVKADE